ncbi:hypothetical protein PPROV_000932300 [Pycnococcus provasolii]|uniref:Uncharacterized protein n=1 Tax=Pycnococcus provasolii TaxID=41880 RepID=A0A830HU04_9CHLO|nr:hypothetical protein PPROV_000932300 [Pycnococcus provasolii]
MDASSAPPPPVVPVASTSSTMAATHVYPSAGVICVPMEVRAITTSSPWTQSTLLIAGRATHVRHSAAPANPTQSAVGGAPTLSDNEWVGAPPVPSRGGGVERYTPCVMAFDTKENFQKDSQPKWTWTWREQGGFFGTAEEHSTHFAVSAIAVTPDGTTCVAAVLSAILTFRVESGVPLFAVDVGAQVIRDAALAHTANAVARPASIVGGAPVTSLACPGGGVVVASCDGAYGGHIVYHLRDLTLHDDDMASDAQQHVSATLSAVPTYLPALSAPDIVEPTTRRQQRRIALPAQNNLGASLLYALPPACRQPHRPRLVASNLHTQAVALVEVSEDANVTDPFVWRVKPTKRGEKLGGACIAATRGGSFNVLVLCGELDRNREGASAIGSVPKLRCLDGEDGTTLWKMSSLEGADAYLTNGGGIRLHMAGAVVSGDGSSLFVSQWDGVVWCISAATGSWITSLHGQPPGSSHSFFRGYTHEQATPPCLCAPYDGELLFTCARDHASRGDTVRAWRVGVPLTWSRQKHGRFPAPFKEAVRTLLRCVSRARRGLAEVDDAQNKDAAHARAVLDAMAREIGLVDVVVEALAEAWYKLERRRQSLVNKDDILVQR